MAVADELGAEHEVCDVGDREAVERMAAAVMARHPKIGLLVNNAGIPGRTGFLDADPERHRGRHARELPRRRLVRPSVSSCARGRPPVARRQRRLGGGSRLRSGHVRPVHGVQARPARLLPFGRERARAARHPRPHGAARASPRRRASRSATSCRATRIGSCSRPTTSRRRSSRPSSGTAARCTCPATTGWRRSPRPRCPALVARIGRGLNKPA